MARILEFKLVTGVDDDIEDFNNNVNDHIKSGWQPIYSPFVILYDTKHKMLYFQSMVKYKKSKKGTK